MQIQPNERDKIAVWFSKGLSIREIGRRLGRHHTVISRELKRNRFKNNYVAIHAQEYPVNEKVEPIRLIHKSHHGFIHMF